MSELAVELAENGFEVPGAIAEAEPAASSTPQAVKSSSSSPKATPKSAKAGGMVKIGEAEVENLDGNNGGETSPKTEEKKQKKMKTYGILAPIVFSGDNYTCKQIYQRVSGV